LAHLANLLYLKKGSVKTQKLRSKGIVVAPIITIQCVNDQCDCGPYYSFTFNPMIMKKTKIGLVGFAIAVTGLLSFHQPPASLIK
jgi:hypothetical protein